jgi:hypothetical protein
VTTLSETNPLPFIAVTPCRLADTRGNGFTGQYGPPSLVANANRSFTIAGQCGIPASAAAVSFNFAALNVGAAGDLRVFPAGGSVPLVSTLNYNSSTPNIANAAIVELGAGGAITVRADAVSIDLIIDVNGYYASMAANQANGFKVVNNGGSTVPAIWGETDSTSTGAAGVYGLAAAVTGETFGIHGVNNSNTDGSAAVLGISFGTTNRTYGLFGNTSSIGAGAAGVWGQAYGVYGQTYGVEGLTASTDPNSAGVLGFAGSRTGTVSFRRAGVRGESATDLGVLGLTNLASFSAAVAGEVMNPSLGIPYAGFLGDAAIGLGVSYAGGIGGSGPMNFYEPHPTDPEKVIRYVSLEGPEAGTYFRGTGHVIHGQAVITVPEDFRIVTDEEGLTVQLTPVGSSANMWIASEDLNQITVRSSKDVAFHYLVQGVRRNYKDFEVVAKSPFFQPRSPDDRMTPSLSEGEKARLIANGTFNPDGTVNMQTAERLGWAAAWRAREDALRSGPTTAAPAPNGLAGAPGSRTPPLIR